MNDSSGVDFGKAAVDYGRHRQGLPASAFERLRARGIGAPGQRILDVGTGTGQMARGLARGGARVTGLDRSAEMLAVGRELDRRAGVTVARVCAAAEATGLDAGTFDVVSASQCWYWFDQERVGPELLRVLRPGGWLVICQLDWLPRAGSVVEATEALILTHNPSWELAGLDGLPTRYVADVEAAGFVDVETCSYDVDLAYTHEAWRGRIRASAGVGASLDDQGVERFDREHARMLAERFSDDPLGVPHRVFVVLAVKPA